MEADHITFTNCSGRDNIPLAEFVIMGMLYFTKNAKLFMEQKKQAKWEKHEVDLACTKTMVVFGFGEIGSACGRIAKAIGTRVIGVKRRPEILTAAQKECADEIVGND